MNPDITAAIGELLSRNDQSTPARAWNPEKGRAVLERLGEEGWLAVGIDESDGGLGGDLYDAASVVAALAGSGWPNPAADLLMVSSRLLAHARHPLAAGESIDLVVPVIGELSPGGRVRARAGAVPWAPWADRMIVLAADDNPQVTSVAVTGTFDLSDIHRALNDEPTANVYVDGPVAEVRTLPVSPEEALDGVRLNGSLARTIQTVAAIQRCLDLSVEHAGVRRQFGRPLSAFQSVQQQLAVMAGELAAGEAGMDDAIAAGDARLLPAGATRIISARVRACVAGDVVARAAHQVHGAIGTTQEHELSRHTKNIWTWQDQFGTRAEWSSRLAREALDSEDVWAWLQSTGPEDHEKGMTQ